MNNCPKCNEVLMPGATECRKCGCDFEEKANIVRTECACGAKVVITGNLNLCAHCYTKHLGRKALLWDELGSHYRTHAIGRRKDETRMEWHQRLRELRTQYATRIGEKSTAKTGTTSSESSQKSPDSPESFLEYSADWAASGTEG